MNLRLDPSSLPVAIPARDVEMVSLFLSAKAMRSPKTAGTYAPVCQEFLAWLGKPLVHADVRDMHRWHAWVHSLDVAQATKARYLSTVKSLFTYLSSEGLLPSNPAKALVVGSVDAAPNRFLTIDESTALLAAAPDPRSRALIATLVTTGLRVSELAGMSAGDLIRGPQGGYGIRVLGKGDRIRDVPLPHSVLVLIIDYRRSIQKPLRFDPASSEPVWLNRFGTRLGVLSIQKAVKTTAETAGLVQKVTPHWLRHTAATTALAEDADLFEVQEMLGHRQITTTQRYVHLAKGLQNTAADRIARAILGKGMEGD